MQFWQSWNYVRTGQKHCNYISINLIKEEKAYWKDICWPWVGQHFPICFPKHKTYIFKPSHDLLLWFSSHLVYPPRVEEIDVAYLSPHILTLITSYNIFNKLDK